MPWSTRDTMSLRQEFILLAQQEGSNRRELCRRFSISPQTAYKWLARYAEQGEAGLVDRSRRPSLSPAQTHADLEQAVIALRQQHPAWGGRKI
ncbi:helix-turn-helix domain-containing protein, partial [Cupriavidus basilensis]|uniref:helix-turn-helix domain-containing protein n=1 Tax=Cupriavidus basilensis TaxID=68895 RepID=UPI0020A66EDA